MGQDDGVARDRVMVQATRRALLDDLRRARASCAGGVLLGLLGAWIAAAAGAVMMPLGGAALLVCGIGLMLIPFGLAVLARAAYKISASRRGLRELDERTGLPVARLRAR